MESNHETEREYVDVQYEYPGLEGAISFVHVLSLPEFSNPTLLGDTVGVGEGVREQRQGLFYNVRVSALLPRHHITPRTPPCTAVRFSVR